MIRYIHHMVLLYHFLCLITGHHLCLSQSTFPWIAHRKLLWQMDQGWWALNGPLSSRLIRAHFSILKTCYKFLKDCKLPWSQDPRANSCLTAFQYFINQDKCKTCQRSPVNHLNVFINLFLNLFLINLISLHNGANQVLQ